MASHGHSTPHHGLDDAKAGGISPGDSSVYTDAEHTPAPLAYEEADLDEVDIEDDDEGTHYAPLRPTATTATARERRQSGVVDSVRPTDRDELHRLASTLSRRDTYAELGPGDPALDPSSPNFDAYKWARVMVRLSTEKGIAQRKAGIVFKNLRVTGAGKGLMLQNTVGSALAMPFRLGEVLGRGKEKVILNNFEGVVKPGELLVVLGRPGSGCSTLLKTLMGETKGLKVDSGSVIHYDGIPQNLMTKHFKGELGYNQEVDKHFPHLTVGETLTFASRVRTSQAHATDLSREERADHMARVMMAVFGLSHTYDTMVGNEYVRGVSGGERKRVSIAEMALARAPIAAWDNSTRGLDAATALEFTRALRMSSNLTGAAHLLAIYQASQAIYDEFDKAVVLYEGRQIYFGACENAKQYFLDMGYECPPRQTTGDFLTSVTNPAERRARPGFEDRVPRTPEDFEKYWRGSAAYATLQAEIKEHEAAHPVGGSTLQEFYDSRKEMQSKHQRPKSPYTVSVPMQVKYCTKRAYQRLWNDKASTMTAIIGQTIMALIIGSIFYNTPNNTQSFFQKGGVLFFAVLLNALMAVTEINKLYEQRPIVSKQASYAFYHPFAEAMAGVVSDIPVKFLISTSFNVILYFLAGLRRTPGQFFIFFLFNFVAIFTMSMIFRTIAATTKTEAQAQAVAGVLVLAIVIYTGYVIPSPLMHPWFKWIMYLNPIQYTFEALLVNELHGQTFDCSQLVPAYPGLSGPTFVCATAGAVAGERTVNGDRFLAASYNYHIGHLWRNFGILMAFTIFFFFTYMLATELNSTTESAAEVLVFRRGHAPRQIVEGEKGGNADEEVQNGEALAVGRSDEAAERQQDETVKVLEPQTDVFSWKDVCYDVPVKGGERRLLDHVSGWVKPGTLTALMGVSGAGKTTLLDVLAGRVTMGVITGDMLVSGKARDASFQRKTGYVQQQDLHLETSTVREALRFSAYLRQPKSVSNTEKEEFVEDVIKMLNMEDFAEAVVGVPGEGLNVEQRKLLTIGVELAAKPALLLFLDEPTSGLDSQSSWAIIAFLRKLADNGQAVLATIHQPSAILFQEFDRLLFLAKGGKTVYFGDIGKNSETLLNYFERNGAPQCDPEENPAEYMLTMVGAGASGRATQDWHEVWKHSEESVGVQRELARIKTEMGSQPSHEAENSHGEFAVPFSTQLYHVTTRVFAQYWRTPGYVYSKFVLGVVSALFIGFSFFHADASMQGLQDIVFSIFMLTAILSSMVQQIMPRFILQRDLYEVRERPSKAYSWVAFITANILVEIPYQILLGIMVFACYYYPIYTLGGFQSSERQGLILLYCIQLFIFSSTYAHLLIAALPDAETAASISTLLFSLILTFNGVFQPPQALPGFWIFMYRISPLTYLVSGIVSTGLHDRKIVCSDREVAVMQPLPGTSCGAYLQKYATAAQGQIMNPSAMANCEYCPLSVADQQLSTNGIQWSERWRNFGIVWAYIIFNILGAVTLYYLFRVRRSSGRTARLIEKVKGMVGGKKDNGEKVEQVQHIDAGVENGTKEVAAEPKA